MNMQMAGVPPMGAPGFGLVCQPALERQRQLLQLLAGAPANNNLLLQQPAVPQGVPHTFLPPQRVQLPLQRNAQAAPAEQPASTQDSVVLVEEQQETSKDVRISDQGASTSAGNHQQSPCSGSSSKGRKRRGAAAAEAQDETQGGEQGTAGESERGATSNSKRANKSVPVDVNGNYFYRHVLWEATRKRYRAVLYKPRKTHLGYFTRAEVAARAADVAVLSLGLNKADLNFPESDYKPGSRERAAIDRLIDEDLCTRVKGSKAGNATRREAKERTDAAAAADWADSGDPDSATFGGAAGAGGSGLGVSAPGTGAVLALGGRSSVAQGSQQQVAGTAGLAGAAKAAADEEADPIGAAVDAVLKQLAAAPAAQPNTGLLQQLATGAAAPGAATTSLPRPAAAQRAVAPAAAAAASRQGACPVIDLSGDADTDHQGAQGHMATPDLSLLPSPMAFPFLFSANQGTTTALPNLATLPLAAAAQRALATQQAAGNAAVAALRGQSGSAAPTAGQAAGMGKGGPERVQPAAAAGQSRLLQPLHGPGPGQGRDTGQASSMQATQSTSLSHSMAQLGSPGLLDWMQASTPQAFDLDRMLEEARAVDAGSQQQQQQAQQARLQQQQQQAQQARLQQQQQQQQAQQSRLQQQFTDLLQSVRSGQQQQQQQPSQQPQQPKESLLQLLQSVQTGAASGARPAAPAAAAGPAAVAQQALQALLRLQQTNTTTVAAAAAAAAQHPIPAPPQLPPIPTQPPTAESLVLPPGLTIRTSLTQPTRPATAPQPQPPQPPQQVSNAAACCLEGPTLAMSLGAVSSMPLCFPDDECDCDGSGDMLPVGDVEGLFLPDGDCPMGPPSPLTDTHEPPQPQQQSQPQPQQQQLALQVPPAAAGGVGSFAHLQPHAAQGAAGMGPGAGMALQLGAMQHAPRPQAHMPVGQGVSDALRNVSSSAGGTSQSFSASHSGDRGDGASGNSQQLRSSDGAAAIQQQLQQQHGHYSPSHRAAAPAGSGTHPLAQPAQQLAHRGSGSLGHSGELSAPQDRLASHSPRQAARPMAASAGVSAPSQPQLPYRDDVHMSQPPHPQHHHQQLHMQPQPQPHRPTRQAEAPAARRPAAELLRVEGYSGVWFHTGRSAYRAYSTQIRPDGVKIKVKVGEFSTAEEAARAYDGFVLRAEGPRARTNFPQHDYSHIVPAPAPAPQQPHTHHHDAPMPAYTAHYDEQESYPTGPAAPGPAGSAYHDMAQRGAPQPPHHATYSDGGHDARSGGRARRGAAYSIPAVRGSGGGGGSYGVPPPECPSYHTVADHPAMHGGHGVSHSRHVDDPMLGHVGVSGYRHTHGGEAPLQQHHTHTHRAPEPWLSGPGYTQQHQSHGGMGGPSHMHPHQHQSSHLYERRVSGGSRGGSVSMSEDTYSQGGSVPHHMPHHPLALQHGGMGAHGAGVGALVAPAQPRAPRRSLFPAGGDAGGAPHPQLMARGVPQHDPYYAPQAYTDQGGYIGHGGPYPPVYRRSPSHMSH